MQLSGPLGFNTLYFSSSNFDSGMLIQVSLYGPDKLFIEEIELGEHLPGVYLLEYTFLALGKYLFICTQNSVKVLLGTIMIGPSILVPAPVTPKLVIPGR